MDSVNKKKINEILDINKEKLTISLNVCSHCTLCAESCFLYKKNGDDPTYTPSYKFINTIGLIFKKKGKIKRESLNEMKDILWQKCVLCTRCYCPLGIDIPDLLSTARNICRSQDIYPDYEMR